MRWSAVVSGLAVGIVWAAWHAPLFVMPGYFAAFEFAPKPWWFATNILLGSIVYTWLYNNAVRSVLLLITVHFMENFVGQVTSLPPIGDSITVAVRGLLVLGIIAWFGARTLRRDESRPTPPQSILDRNATDH